MSEWSDNKEGGILLHQQMQLSRAGHCLCTAMNIKLAIDVVEMRFDSTNGDDELLGNCSIRHAGGKTLQDLSFALTEGFDRFPRRLHRPLVSWIFQR